MTIAKAIVSAVVAIAAIGGFALTNSPSVRATDPSVACTKGDSKFDFTGEWTSRDTVTFSTKDNVKLCNDVNVWISSYTMPDNYDGGKFMNNPTATPQTKFSSKQITLKAGTTGATTTTISVPALCKNIQVDAYLGDEVVTVGPEGHDGMAFATKMIQKTINSCEVPKVEACNTETGEVVKVEKGKENIAPYTTDLSKCDEPNMVEVCNTETGEVVKVEETKKNTTPYTTDLSECEEEVTELPKTGASSALMALPLSLLVAGAVAVAQNRRA